MLVKAAVGQICSGTSMAKNLEQCKDLAGMAAAAGASILFLPEASDYIATSASESHSLAKPIESSPFVRGLKDAAKQHNLAIHVGIHDVAPNKFQQDSHQAQKDDQPPRQEQGTPSSSSSSSSRQNPSGKSKLFNTTVYINPDGTLNHAGTYNKLHLFDYGTLVESASTQAGSRFTPPFPSPIGLLGSLICFDLRFPEAALHLAKPGPGASPPSQSPHPEAELGQQKHAEQQARRGGTGEAAGSPGQAAAAEVILYPSAFTVPTGQAHWEPLLRARAIETQSWVVAAAQVGRHHPYSEGGKRVSYGHSMVVDPWGKVVVELKGVEDVGNAEGEGERLEAVSGAVGELGVFEVDLEHVARVRERMPLVRRTDLYSRS